MVEVENLTVSAGNLTDMLGNLTDSVGNLTSSDGIFSSTFLFVKDNMYLLLLLIPIALIVLAYWAGFRLGKKKESDMTRRIEDEIAHLKRNKLI